MFFTFSGKAYCIFALLFGFSFFIQDNSQKQKGKDFRGRFAWRLVLLLFIACINSALFPGEILILYALLGYVLIAVCRLSTRTVTIIAVILLLQPIELGQIIYALINPDYIINADLDAPYWELVNAAQKKVLSSKCAKLPYGRVMLPIWVGCYYTEELLKPPVCLW